MKKEIIAVMDPMCSWCWGFEKELEKLRSFIGDDVKMSIILGGLRGKKSKVWDDSFKAFLSKHWNEVHAKTLQKFNFTLLNKAEFDYNTEPSCRAVVTVREMDNSKVFTVFNALQKAFYEESKDITCKDVISAIIENNGIDKEKFLALFISAKMIEKTEADTYKARSMGANAFPSLVFIDEEGHLSVLKGYRTFQEIQKYM